jgi:uncharacterized protein involved in type VI secretion and phage assembly
MPTVQIPVRCSVKIKDKEYADSVSQVELDQHIDAHHSLLVYIVDTSPTSTSDDFFDPNEAKNYLGETITVTMQYSNDNKPRLKFVGTVTQFTLVNAVDGVNTLRITAASPTVLLDGARKYVSYREIKSSEAINRVSGNYSITKSSIPATSFTWDCLVQHDETDWAFIRRLATFEGYYCYYNGEKLVVEQPNTGASHTLKFREALGSFSIGIGIEQPNFATVLYTEDDNKQLRPDSKSVSKSRSLSGISKIALDVSERTFGASSLVPIGMPGLSAGDADKAVDRERSRAVERMLEGEGMSTVPELRVGMTIEIQGLGNTSGSYYITSVRHSISDRGLYENTFTCIPVDAAFPQQAPKPDAAAGLRRALVVDNKDPEKLGRIKVRTAWFDQEDTAWLRLIAPYAGPDYGWYALPEVGDEVLVGYVEGDFQQPFVLGSLYNSTNKPAAAAYNDENNIKLFQTRSGNLIMIDDTSGGEEITISSASEKSTVVLSNKEKLISITTLGDIKLKADGNIQVESQKDISMKATGNVTIEGQKISLKSTADTAIQGMNVEIKADIGLKASGGAQAELKASGQMAIKGAMVMIN